MQLLRRDNDCALFLNADELLFVRFKRASPTFTFISLLVGFILFVNGIVQLIISNQGFAAILITIGLALLYLGYWFKKKSNMNQHTKPTVENTILIVDTCEKEIFTGKRIHLGHLSECRFNYNFQMTASAKSLILEHPKGKLLIVKGNVFGGSHKPFYSELKKYALI